jgi:hypothetical protein
MYHDPHSVIHPRKYIRKVSVLYDGKEDGFSLAIVDWEGTPHIGIRWNVAAKEQSDPDKVAGTKVCDGSPATRSIPSWFILPRELFDPALFNKDSGSFLNLVAGWQKNDGFSQ